MRDNKKDADIDDILSEKWIKKEDIRFRVLISTLFGIQYWLFMYAVGFSKSFCWWGINFYSFMLVGYPILIFECTDFLIKIIRKRKKK